MLTLKTEISLSHILQQELQAINNGEFVFPRNEPPIGYSIPSSQLWKYKHTTTINSIYFMYLYITIIVKERDHDEGYLIREHYYFMGILKLLISWLLKHLEFELELVHIPSIHISIQSWLVTYNFKEREKHKSATCLAHQTLQLLVYFYFYFLWWWKRNLGSHPLWEVLYYWVILPTLKKIYTYMCVCAPVCTHLFVCMPMHMCNHINLNY